MKAMNINNIIIGAAMLFAVPCTKAQEAAPNGNSHHEAVDTPFVHDPVMAWENGVCYLYCTGHGIGLMTSTDGNRWTINRGGVLSNNIPAWTRDSVSGFENHIWAPDIIRYRNKWYQAYSCSTFGKNTSAIGLLSNTSLANASGWKDEGCIVSSKGKRNDWNAIDPNFIIDEKGKPWMTWGSFWDGIQMVQLDKNMHVKRGAKPFTIARRHSPGDTTAEPNPTSKYAGTNAIEAPFIMRHGDYYYLFVSWDYCCRGIKSNYRVAVGRSKNVAGPYLDRNGKDMLTGGGTIILEGDKKEYEAMGHCAAYHHTDLPADLFICHGYSVAKNGASILVKKRINWTSDGWLTLEPW